MRQLLARVFRKLATLADTHPEVPLPNHDRALQAAPDGLLDEYVKWVSAACAGWLERGKLT